MRIRESRFGRLVGHFFGGFLDNDLLMSAEAGMHGALSQIIGLIVAPGLFYCLLSTLKYSSLPARLREFSAWEDRLLFVSLAMILTGLLTVIEWDALFPDRRDYEILSPLPITTRLLFLAKLSSVLLLLAVFWAAANLGPAFLFSAVVVTPAEPWFALPRAFLAHLIATFTASAFVFLFFVGLEGLLLNVLAPKWFRRVSVYAQLAAVLLLVLGLFLLPLLLAHAAAWIRGDSSWVYALPPFWFLGLYQAPIGSRVPLFAPLAAIGMKVLGAVAALSALAYYVSYQRHVRRSLESLQAARSGPGLFARALEAALHHFALRHPLERACFHYVRATLLRSRFHRLVLGAYLGAGCALVLVIVGVAAQRAAGAYPTPGLLSIQLVLSFLLLSGIRFAFTIPAELRANWAFQATEPSERNRCGAGVRKAMLAFGAWPMLAGLLPVHCFLWSWRLAAAHLLYGATLAVLLAEILLLGFDKIPFTCTYLPGKANLKLLWPVYLGAFWAYAYAMAKLEYALLANPASFGLFCAAATACTLALRWFRRRQFRPGFRFRFEDLPEPAVRTLDISH